MAFFSQGNEPCEPGAWCIEFFDYQLILNYQNSMYIGVGFVLLVLVVYSLWPQAAAPPLPPPANDLEAVEREIEKRCVEVSGLTTGIFVFSLFLSILRPDPTPAVTLFGFYGVRSSWCDNAVLMSFCVLIDGIWRSNIHHVVWPPVAVAIRR